MKNKEIIKAGEAVETVGTVPAPSPRTVPVKGKRGRGPKPAKAARVLVGGAAVTLSDEQRKADRAIRKLSVGSVAERTESLARERALVADLIGTAEERAVMAGIADSVAQAKVRGEAVDQPKAGPVRVRSRDSLAELFTRESITGEQYLAGCAYRTLYEACHSGAPSQLRPRVGGSGKGGDDWAFRRAKLEAQRSDVEVKVAVAARAAEVDPSLAKTVLRLVAGEGAPLNPPGGCSRTKRRRIVALRVALVAAGVVLRVTGSVKAATQVATFETNGQDCAFARAPDTTQSDA